MDNWYLSPGIITTSVLILIVLIAAALILVAQVNKYLEKMHTQAAKKEKLAFSEYLINLETAEVEQVLEERRKALGHRLTGRELGSGQKPTDQRGLISKLSLDPDRPFFDEKKSLPAEQKTSSALTRLIMAYLSAATFWLVFGTLIGQYLGMKFVLPELDSISWLSFGRIRPVHTNTVFWGWSSLAMIGLAYYVVTRTSNNTIYSYKWGWTAFWMINGMLVAGNLCLMAGINNGGGEYREYIWPVALLFIVALLITFFNFYKTIASRKIGEIYISNWYILAGLLWTLVLSVIGYLPFSGLGETVTQGYYMHQGVGMWFMTFTLGLIYYYLPTSLNKPIYSYSLGVLAFWTQMLFYTMIGTHHFVFSPLPWWLQTVAIVFSAGMFIPVVAGTTNFLMTMKGSWKAISSSYVLPFFLVGVIFYFVGSTQGSVQALRFTNDLWHFTDFNVAHSHMTMYGIISFILWACIYAIVPRLSLREPRQLMVGMHFWFAFIGLMAYMISLMAGGTLKGMSWIEGKPFIESVTLMMPFWVWRAIGGTMMFFSHLVFAWNIYTMLRHLKTEKIHANALS
ncbi:cytochrome c oxidase cbb3-type subunit 1 [Anseongella ginsenosidimutans]|uniref:Cytochrome c oxidase cbb3-type subunit 1 n=1 Tax=Anseongella ginsenosidimutans TaxID=496056 RepID=A0A4R3KSM5_9SPHI|nr:cbb3-type cytochrome c oxidase subunit I [Anseongella ginsenosidimutans]QEC53170.1 cytochrome oxidase subunit I [Anseongella ginsenosidimutans]TCS87796.1 cytochrome c oxidase cbb3-type subunit 1 [Anseongella ginsenosidimutans]